MDDEAKGADRDESAEPPATGHQHRDDPGQYDVSALYGSECREALDTLYRFLDGELDQARRSEIQHHLDRCSPCLGAFDFEAELKVIIAHRCRETVPDSLRIRVAAALTEASKTFGGTVDRATMRQPFNTD